MDGPNGCGILNGPDNFTITYPKHTVKRVYLDSETAIIHFQFTISLCNLCPAGFAKLRFEYWNNGQ